MTAMVKQGEASESGKKTTQVVRCAERSSPQQDSCWSWLVCFAGVVSNVAICGFTYSYGILFPALLDEFQQGKAKTAWVGSIAMVGIGLYGPLIGRLYQRFGARLVSFFGSLICIASLIATSKVSNLYVMFVTYGALFGFGSGCIFIVTYIAVPSYFTKWRSLSLGLIAMGPGGGLFIMSPIVQLLFENFGWRRTFLSMAGIDVLMCLLAFVYRPVVLDSEKEELKTNEQKEDKKFWDISLLKHKAFVLSSLAGVIFYLAHYIPPVHMVRYLEEVGFSEVVASRLYIYSGVASLLVRPAIGRLNDFSWINMIYIYSVASGILGLVTLLLPMATSNVHFIAYFVVYGLADGTMGSGLSIAVLYSLPERLRPLGFGVYQSVTCVTSACGPALGGLVADLQGSYDPVFYMAGAIMIFATAILLTVSCVKKSKTLTSKEEVKVWESLLVVEKCSVV